MNSSTKHFFALATIVLLCFQTFAQVSVSDKKRFSPKDKHVDPAPLWQPIGTPFVTTSITGQTVDLQALLSSGKNVVIEYTYSMSSPSWMMHCKGVLDSINQLDDVVALWIEVDPRNTNEEIFGNSVVGQTQGNWTQDTAGNPVSYAVINDADRSCQYTCSAVLGDYVPSVVFISSSGYCCQIYDEPFGYDPYTPVSQVVDNINYLTEHSPASGELPLVRIKGPQGVMLGDTAMYVAEYISVDSVLSVQWESTNFTDLIPNGDTAWFHWDDPYPQRIILSVTNTVGTASDTLFVNINSFHWDDEMTYVQDSAFVQRRGYSDFTTWGIRIPAQQLAGRHYLRDVKLYSITSYPHKLQVYQTPADNIPTSRSLVYEHTYTLSNDSAYNTLPIYGQLPLDETLDLWIVFTCDGFAQPACATTYSGNPNGSYINYSGVLWGPFHQYFPNDYVTWMIKATTSDTAILNAAIEHPRQIFPGQPALFTAVAPNVLGYEWTFNGANPSSSTAVSASPVWDQSGEYIVRLKVFTAEDTLELTETISVLQCDPTPLPHLYVFEGPEDLNCWFLVDADGDGFGWSLISDQVNADDPFVRSVIGSASYINNIGPLMPDNWMISPELVIPEQGATLTYSTGSPDDSYYREHYAVLVSTTGSNLEDFTHTLWEGEVDTWRWTSHHLDLSAFAGQTIRLAFRHYQSYDVFWIFIDNIQVSPGPSSIDDVQMLSQCLYPNPTTGVLHIDVPEVQLVTVLDINGHEVLSQRHAQYVDLGDLAGGIYYVRVVTTKGVGTTKIVKR